MSETPQDAADGTPKRFDSVDVLYAAKDVLRAADRVPRFYTVGVVDLVAELLGVSHYEAEGMLEALGERR